MKRLWISCVLVICLILAGQSSVRAQTPVSGVENLVPKILAIRPHDTTAYTEGLFWEQGTLYESTGNYGSSDLRQLNPDTGAIIRKVDLYRAYFGEGIALIGKRLIQMTWLEQVAFVYDVDTFKITKAFRYAGEGWGLCYDGQDLYMSNGSNEIAIRDPETFEIRRTIPVTLNGVPVPMINELECVGDQIYANIYRTLQIVRFNKSDGKITALIDATNLLAAAQPYINDVSIDVLNGIAYQPEKKFFYLTGKFWPVMFEAEFVPAATAK